MMKSSTATIYPKKITGFAALFLLVLIAGCSLEKESRFNRSMQNLTARYNILFNAREIITQKEAQMAANYPDDYQEILSVYQDTAAKTGNASKEMAAVTTRANNIISLKEQSHYLGDAYFLLGQANYLDSDYFNAVEFFTYVSHSFPEEKELVKTALAWKARALLKLDQPKKAALALDTARMSFDAKKPSAGVITGADLQLQLDQGDYEAAEPLAAQLVGFAADAKQRIRYTFILAQIQEANKKPEQAYENYTRVVHSNASFELAFNANLNRLRIEEKQNGQQTDRATRLLTLLKDDKNADFIDQIYYQIAETYMAQPDLDNAIKNYKLSIKSSTRNQKQKALSYLRLADIAFKYRNDYTQSKNYYDSTLRNLSPAYPGYQQILKKANNLQLLASKFQVVGHQDTLQTLAKLNEADRNARIAEIVEKEALQQTMVPVSVIPPINNGNVPASSGRFASSFYFYNQEAVTQGLIGFLHVWGKRKLEDNWRISSRVVPLATVNPAGGTDPDVVQAVQEINTAAAPKTIDLKQDLIASIPLTPALLQQSNQIIFNAYFDIAGIYRDILDDKPEAINTYEFLVNKYPENQSIVAIYYSLYRLYTDANNQPLAEKYKNLLLKNYPETQYAKIILDPNYAQKMLSADASQNNLYNTVYNLYRQRNYQAVISKTDSALTINPQQKLAPQFAYLKAIAQGHQQKLAPFKAEMQQIATQYPDDRLITPLVNEHLLFINANEALIAARPFALIDSDPDDLPFSQDILTQQNAVVATQQNTDQMAVAQKAAPVIPPAEAVIPSAPLTLASAQNSATINAIKSTLTNKVDMPSPQKTENSALKEASKIFTLADSSDLYFVVNVIGNFNLAPSRFGIGQFNRANYASLNINHQLKDVGQNNELIYVGRFYSIAEVKDYARRMVPLLPEIMKIPAANYNFFIISRKNLDKLANSKLIDSYFGFYQANYL